MNRSDIREYQALIERFGGQLVDTTKTGKGHYKMVVSARGLTRFFIAGNSPSDRRAVQNFIGEVRRWLREIGA